MVLLFLLILLRLLPLLLHSTNASFLCALAPRPSAWRSTGRRGRRGGGDLQLLLLHHHHLPKAAHHDDQFVRYMGGPRVPGRMDTSSPARAAPILLAWLDEAHFTSAHFQVGIRKIHFCLLTCFSRP